MKLISMTDFVLKKTEECRFIDDCEFAYLIRNYAKFLKQPLTLSMFIPCDEEGNVLEEPIYNGVDEQYYGVQIEKYQKAKESVIFDGCEFVKEDENSWKIKHNGNIYTFLKDFTIEDLIDLNLTITDSAIKKYKLS